MKKYLLSLACMALMSAQAQNIYEIERVSSNDLNGTARFVGMGGAMNALGADLSTMGGNPAAIGMYRRSDAALSFSVQSQQDAVRYGGQRPTQMSFDQAGAVYALRTSGKGLSFVNFGFNYQKSHNLKQYIGTPLLPLDGRTLTKQLSQQMYMSNPGHDDYMNYNSIISNGAENAGLIYPAFSPSGEYEGAVGYWPGESYAYERAHWGYVGEYDLNVSFNVDDRIYLGATVGIYSVRSRSNMYYEEYFDCSESVVKDMSYDISETQDLRGSGFDFKFGTIIRPIAESPFRFGLAVHTPRVLNLSQYKTLSYRTTEMVPFPIPLDPQTLKPYDSKNLATGDYDYRIITPWRVQFSAATTIGSWLALDAEYEAAMFKNSSIRYPSDNVDYYDVAPRTDKDYFVKDEVKACMRPQHTLRLGVEAHAGKVYGRLGYNLVTSAFKKDAFLNYSQPFSGDIETNRFGDVKWVDPEFRSSYNMTSTDYVNLGAVNRFSLGLGLHGKSFYADIAYVCQRQKADVYAFSDMSYGYDKKEEMFYLESTQNAQPAYTTNLVRHSVLFTLGFKF